MSTQPVADLVVSHHPTSYAVANEDTMTPDRLAKDQVVERCHGVDLVRAHLQVRSNLPQALIRDPSPMCLHYFQRFDARSLTIRHRRHRMIDLNLFFLRRSEERRVGKASRARGRS